MRHLRTAESTHARTMGYMLLICGTIVAASFVQVPAVGVRVVGGWAEMQLRWAVVGLDVG